jgi:dihydropyrimidinase
MSPDRLDLLVRGGDVVTPAGRRNVDAKGLLVLPGAVDVHTHVRVASDAEPDRFFQDSVAAAYGGTTTFLAFNNPGTGSSPAAARSLRVGLQEFRDRTAGDSAVDYGLSLAVLGSMDDPVAELPEVIERGVPTAKAFMVFDFRLDDRRLFAVLEALGRLGGMLQVHCEDPVLIDAAVAAALQRGNTSPYYHATTRPDYVEAAATHRAIAFARLAGAPVYVVHLSCAAALDEVRRGKAAGVAVFAETCPHYLTLTAERYERPAAEAIRYVISPPLRAPEDRASLWAGLADGSLDLVATDHVPDRLAVEKRVPPPPFDRISNGAPGIETLLAIGYSEGVATGRLSIERLVDLVATTPARLFGLPAKGSIELGKDADLVLFDPAARRTIRAETLHHTSEYTPYEGLEVAGAVRSVYVRGRAVVEDGRFVGRRGWGRFVERIPPFG